MSAFEGPGITALGLAASRAVESGRPDRLIDDPYARALFEAAEADLPMRCDWPAEDEQVTDTEALHLHGSRYIGLRTRHYDDAVVAADQQQVVLLGAGLDTRAFRLELPSGLSLFELDRGPVLDHKAAVMSAVPRCRHVPVPVDLREEWAVALTVAGFDPQAPALFVAEGLVPYLDPEAQVRFAEAIDALSAPGSALELDRIAGDPASPGRLESLSERSGIEMGALIEGGGSDSLPALLGSLGWSVAEQSATDLAARYGRDLANPFGADAAEPPWLETVFTSARRGGP